MIVRKQEGQLVMCRLLFLLFTMATKREEIEPTPGDKRYIRRNQEGQIETSVNVHKSLSQDDRHNAKETSKPGQGDHGDGHTGSRKRGE